MNAVEAIVTTSMDEQKAYRKNGYHVDWKYAELPLATSAAKYEYHIRKNRVLLVGRHTTGDVAPGVEVVAQEAVTFSTDINACIDQIKALVAKAKEIQADSILLQNTPGIFTAALMHISGDYLGDWRTASTAFGIGIGVIISVPGERKAGVVTEYEFGDDCGFSGTHANKARDAVLQANARAKVELRHDGNYVSYLTVTVDPVTEFIFSHIEWL